MIRFRAVLWAALLPLLVHGQDAATTNGVAPLSQTNLTVAAFQVFITNFQAKLEVPEAVRKSALESYQAALKLAGDRDGFAAVLAKHEENIAGASNLVASLKGELSGDAIRQTNAVDTALGSKETDTIINQVESDLRVAREALTSLQAEPKRRSNRKEEIPKAVSAAKAKLDEIGLALKAKAPEGQAAEVTQAIRRHLLTRQNFRRSEIAALEAEVRAYDATDELLTLQTDRQALRVSQLTKQLEALRAHFNAAKKTESKAAADKARAELESRLLRDYLTLNELAQGNLTLATNQLTVTDDLRKATRDLTSSEQELAALKTSFRTLVERVKANESAGVRISDSVGRLLRRHRAELARKAGLHQRVRARLSQINDAQLAELERQEDKSALVDLEGAVERTVQAIKVDQPKLLEEEQQRVTAKSRDLLKSRRTLLTELVDSYQSLNDALIKLNQTEIEMDKQVGAFANYVEERVLWVRSTDNLGVSGLAGEISTIGRLLNPANWNKAVNAASRSFADSPVVNGLWLILLILAFFFQPKARKALRLFSESAQEREQVSLLPTLRSVFLTVVLAVPGPLAMCLCGSLLQQAESTDLFISGLAKGLSVGALLYFTLGLYRHVARMQGLGGGHFGWPETNIKLIRRHLIWFMPPAIVLVTVIAFIEAQAAEGTPARLSLIALAVLTSAVCYFLLHPTRGISYTTMGGIQHEGRRRIRFLAGILVPIAIAIVSARGYHFTAVEFGWRMMNSVWLIVGITLLSAVILRWFYLERKAIALEKLRKKREAAAADPEAAKAIAQEIPEVNITEVKEQTQSLLRTVVLVTVLGGLWLIWSDVLPALNVFEKRTLWHVKAAVEETPAEEQESKIPGLALPVAGSPETTPAAANESTPKTILKPITLADLLTAAIIVLLTFIAGRNLPGFLEISLLKHLQLEPGGGYAVTTLVQYVVALVGTIAAFAAIGITWEKVQWLAAAITLGIGFGLQEIFANFVAGLIILFERPIRKDDTVTVGEVTGTVTKIRIRATTITDWDRKELVVPNKEFITGQLVNWSLTDSITRFVLNVGVAYGSDTDLTTKLLYEVAAEHPRVLNDPEPRVVFSAFGASSLDFQLLMYFPNLDRFWRTKHELHMAVDKKFREHKVEIAFPQLDLHVRDLPATVETKSGIAKPVQDAPQA